MAEQNHGTYIDDNDGIEKSIIDPGETVRVFPPPKPEVNSKPQEIPKGKIHAPTVIYSDISKMVVISGMPTPVGSISNSIEFSTGEVVWGKSTYVEIGSISTIKEKNVFSYDKLGMGYRELSKTTLEYYPPGQLLKVTLKAVKIFNYTDFSQNRKLNSNL